jgi:outer membrane protein TolC
LLLISALGLSGQETEPTQTLTLDLEGYVSRVISQGPDMKMFAKDLDTAEAMKQEAWATALPKVILNAGYNRNLRENYLFVDFPGMGEQQFKINYKNEFSWQAIINQPLFSFKIGAALTAAKQYEKLVEAGFQLARHKMTTAARKIFYQTILLERVFDVRQASEENARENLALMKLRYEAGQISRLQLLQAESRYKSTVPETIRARRNLELAQNSLKILADIELTVIVTLKGDFDSLPPLPQPLTLRDVLPQRPDFEALKWQERLQETGIKAQKADQLPKLDLNLAYNFSAISDQFKLERRNNAFVVGLKLNFPVFTGGYVSAQVKKARIDRERTQLKMESLQKQIEKDLRDVNMRLLGARDGLEAARQSLLTAKEAFAVTEVTVESGLSTQLELKDARLLYDQALMGYYLAGFEYLTAIFDWQETIGHPSLPGS